MYVAFAWCWLKSHLRWIHASCFHRNLEENNSSSGYISEYYMKFLSGCDAISQLPHLSLVHIPFPVSSASQIQFALKLTDNYFTPFLPPVNRQLWQYDATKHDFDASPGLLYFERSQWYHKPKRETPTRWQYDVHGEFLKPGTLSFASLPQDKL